MSFITAHAGCEGEPPASGRDIQKGLESGADGVEVDVRAWRGVPYLNHDALAEGSGALLLRDALALVRPHKGVLVNLDIKEDEALLPALKVARDEGMLERVMITGVLSDAANADAIAVGAWRWRNVYREKGETAEEAAARIALEAFPWKVVNMNMSSLDDALFHALTARGLRVSAWTADENADIERLLRLGVYSVTTRRPKRAVSLRDGRA